MQDRYNPDPRKRTGTDITEEMEAKGQAGPAFTGESTKKLIQLRKPDAETILSYLKNERDFNGDEIDTLIAALEEALA